MSTLILAQPCFMFFPFLCSYKCPYPTSTLKLSTGLVTAPQLVSFRILLKKSGTKTPRVELEEIGPSLDLVKGRSKLASDDLWKRATKKPRAVKVIMCAIFRGATRGGLGGSQPLPFLWEILYVPF